MRDLPSRLKEALAIALADSDRHGAVCAALVTRSQVALTVEQDDELAMEIADVVRQAERHARARAGLIPGVRQEAGAR